MSIRNDFTYCKTCRKYTDQLLLEELEELVITSNDSPLQKFKCGACQRINERELHRCWYCQKFTSQSLIDEKDSDMIVDEVDQIFKCCVCEKINETSRHSDEFLQRFLNAKDEEGGVYC